MRDHANVEKVRTASEALLRGDIGPWRDLIAEDVIWHEIGGRTIHGREALEASMADMESAEFTGEVHDVVGNDEHVVALVKVTVDTGDGPFSYRTAELYHMSDGEITERWSMAEDTQPIVEYFSGLG